MAATATCAGSASVSASTASGMPTATSPRWPPPRSTGRWRGSNASCSPPIGPRPRRSTATPPPQPIWPARAAQRRHDALVEMATRALTAPADGKRPAPLVTVMVDFDTLAGRVCELAAGTVIAPGAVAELLGHDETLIQRVVADGPNRVRGHQLRPQLPGHPAPRPRGPAPALRPQDLLRARRPMPRRPHPRLVRRRPDHPGQRPARLRPPQPLVVHHRTIPPTTTRPRRSDAPLDDDELDDEPDDHVGPRPRPRFMLRIALASAPDLQVGDGDERCTIDLHPLGHTTDRWRDYPIHTTA